MNRQKKRNLANAAIVTFVLGCASVFFTVGTIGGFKISTLLSVAILALFVFGSLCGAVYIVYVLVSRGTALFKQNRPPLRSVEWWRR